MTVVDPVHDRCRVRRVRAHHVCPVHARKWEGVAQIVAVLRIESVLADIVVGTPVGTSGVTHIVVGELRILLVRTGCTTYLSKIPRSASQQE